MRDILHSAMAEAWPEYEALMKGAELTMVTALHGMYAEEGGRLTCGKCEHGHEGRDIVMSSESMETHVRVWHPEALRGAVLDYLKARLDTCVCCLRPKSDDLLLHNYERLDAFGHGHDFAICDECKEAMAQEWGVITE